MGNETTWAEVAHLKEVFGSDKRGLSNQEFVEQSGENTAILSYYGMGDSHEGVFEYSPVTGWKFIRCYDRVWEESTPEEQGEMMDRIIAGLQKIGLTEAKETDNGIEFSRPTGKEAANG